MASTTSSTLGNLLRASGRVPVRRKQILHPGSLGMLVGGLLLIVGSLVPWIVVAGLTMYGGLTQKLLLLSAGFIAVAGAVIPRRWPAVVHGAIAGLTGAALVVGQLYKLVYYSATTDAWGAILPSVGLVMVGGAAVVLLATALRLARTPAVAPSS